MKLYIVYEGEFCTDKPRERMATPSIILVTTNKEKAEAKVNDMYDMYKDIASWEQLDKYDNSFEFNNEYDTYGKVGIIEKDLED